MTEQEQIKYEIAKKRVKKIKEFYIHLLVYVVVNLFLIVNKAQGRRVDYFFTFNTFSIAFYWGLGVVYHAITVFGFDMFLSKNWEEKKIKEYMAEEKKRGWE